MGNREELQYAKEVEITRIVVKVDLGTAYQVPCLVYNSDTAYLILPSNRAAEM